MDLGLSGRAALVTGGARGIGAAIAETLAAEGCDVMIVDRSLERAPDVVAAVEAAGARAHAVEADVRSMSAAEDVVAQAVATFGRLDVLVCNAGINRDAVLWKMTEEAWDDVIDVNLKGYFNYNRAVAPVLRGRGWGRIVNVASINGLRGKRGQANYAAAKAGEIALTKTVARELGAFGVTVNAVAPGMVTTPMTRGLPAEVLERAVSETVLGRLADPHDVANAVVFLCSERARHITGEVVRVDGGQCM